MRQNIQRTEQRQGNINELDTRTGSLAEQAHEFQRGSNKVMRKFRWKDARMWGWGILGVAILVIIIALSP